MIASVLIVDRAAIKGLKIRNAYSIHKIVYNLFPGDKRCFLFFDQGGDFRGRKILIMSEGQPLIPEYGEIQSKKIPYDYLDSQNYAFQVRLNPVMRKTGSSKFIPICGNEELEKWFLRRQEDWGFKIHPDSLEISDTGIEEIEKGNQTILYNKAIFKGICSVNDKAAFVQSFTKGIGRGKAFGFGLLQIKPLSVNS